MSLDNYLRTNPSPTEDQLRELLSGHLCRCTGYTPIIRAAMEAAATLASSTQQEDRAHV
jgi:2-furoyl-CoA dehydrogenase 2Fe-2S iron sulfur subunit